MKLSYCYIALFLLSLFNPARSQDCITPTSPLLKLVSVSPGPTTGKSDIVNLSWEPGSTESIDAFIVYQYSERDNGYMAFDTVWNPQSRSYTYTTFAARQLSLRYVVASYRKPLAPGRVGCPSPLSNSLETIFLRSAIDTCESTITLTWNKYSDNPSRVSGYNISVSVNGAPITETYSRSADSARYVIKNFTPDSQYCFTVRAILENGEHSGSNNSCLTSTIQTPPEWINTDYISVNEQDDIELSFTIDQKSEIRKYLLERSDENQPYKTVAILNGVRDRIAYTDRDADVTKVHFYRLSALNSCDKPVKVTEASSNIRLVLTSEDDEIILAWNRVRPDDHEGYTYELWLNTGDGFEPEGSTGTVPEFRIKLTDIIYRISGGEVCFYVKATVNSSLHGSNGESISSRVCISPGEGITVPNLFTPDNDLRNDMFRPVLAFTPREYHLIVSNRSGKILFETRNPLEEWDGSGADEGVYLWWLKVITPSGKSLSKTGTITIIR